MSDDGDGDGVGVPVCDSLYGGWGVLRDRRGWTARRTQRRKGPLMGTAGFFIYFRTIKTRGKKRNGENEITAIRKAVREIGAPNELL